MSIPIPRLTHTSLAVIRFALMFAPLYFIAADVMKYELGVLILSGPLEHVYAPPQLSTLFDIFSPFVFLGGLCLAFLCNSLPIVRFNFRWEADSIVSAMSVRTHRLNLAVIGLSGLLLSVLVGYLLVENIAHSAVG